MKYAEVCVNSPLSQRRTFSYSIPEGMDVLVGHAVFVPFGNKILQGIVMFLEAVPAVEETKEIAGLIQPLPLLSPAGIALAYWLSEYYVSPLFDAVALMLPPGFERSALTFISVRSVPDNFDLSTLNEEQGRMLAMIKSRERVGQKELQKAFGKLQAVRLISQLAGRGLVEKTYELEPVKVNPRLESFVSLVISPEQATIEIAALEKTRLKRQPALLAYLAGQPGPVTISKARREASSDKMTIDTLAEKGLISIQQVEVKRDPLADQAVTLALPLALTPDQDAAFQAICGCLKDKRSLKPEMFLLHGVTGSGKTEIYLRCLSETVKLGKRGIVLVPEISLTPQTIERFSSRFPGRVAVIHSQLSMGEQFDEWNRIRRGNFDVVIGPRSALFAPQPDLGLIILDEEHEWTYKQSDPSPRYHARNAAMKLAELTGATVVLGSATPDVETFYHAVRGDFHLVELPERVTPYRNSPLPPVEIVDMREELKSGNRSMFSRSLSDSVTKALAGGEQVMLFLNRRGGATFVQCRDCGYVVACRRCNVPMSYHPIEDLLVCHQCNYRMKTPTVCPKCGSRRIKFLGVGTQKLEQETASVYPKARLLRWDSDSVEGRREHQEMLEKFRNHEADILIGTQMIAKGLDLPRVTVVGVVNADTALNLPDFRAGERTFQLLTQVAGRAGRGMQGGRVIFQTYSPENYAIQAAAGHDYRAFYAKEIEYRRQLNNPPFSQLVRLVYSHRNDSACRDETERIKKVISDEIAARGIPGLSIIGPAPAFISRLRGRYRWQIILRGQELSGFLSVLSFPQGWTVDVDPVGL